MAGKPDLRGRNIHPRGDQHLPGNPHDPFPWPNTGTRGHLRDSFTGHVCADRREIPIRHLKDLRAIEPVGALQPHILSQTSNKHNVAFRLKFPACAEYGTTLP
jgi:hypothetical protein